LKENTVKSLLARGRKKLEAELGDEYRQRGGVSDE